jgi:hypothetical protein
MFLLFSLAQAATISWTGIGTVAADEIAICPDGSAYTLTGSTLRRLSGNAVSGTLGASTNSMAWNAGHISCGKTGSSVFNTLMTGFPNMVAASEVYSVAIPGGVFVGGSSLYSVPSYIGDVKAMSSNEFAALSADGYGDRGFLQSLSFPVFGYLPGAREFAATQSLWNTQEIGFAANYGDEQYAATLWINAGNHLDDADWQMLDPNLNNQFVAYWAEDMEAVRTESGGIYLFVLDHLNNVWRGTVTL